MRRRRYIHDGSVIGDPSWIPQPWYTFIDWKRVAWIMIPVLVLLVTNPSNQQVVKNMMSSTPKKSKWLMPRVTNYGLFSLEEKIEGVVISSLQQNVLCSYRNPKFGEYCEFMADNLCHQKPLLWDSNDNAYTTHRIICTILILSALYGFCCPNAPPRRVFSNPVAEGILISPFYPPNNLLHDLLYETLCVYPTLVEIQRIIPKLNRGSMLCTGDETFDFFIAIFLLVCVIGGGSNVVATRIDGQRSFITGFLPVIAAALAYYQRISVVRSTILMTMLGCNLTATRLYWSSIGWIILSYPNSWFPRLMSWLIAGLAGSFLAKYHLENIAVWGDVMKFFGLT